jgi:hypothetical protein
MIVSFVLTALYKIKYIPIIYSIRGYNKKDLMVATDASLLY